jgi:hypothetical protein
LFSETSAARLSAGKNDFGPYSFQNGMFDDGRDEIKIVFKDISEISKSWEGREIELACRSPTPRRIVTGTVDWLLICHGWSLP